MRVRTQWSVAIASVAVAAGSCIPTVMIATRAEAVETTPAALAKLWSTSAPTTILRPAILGTSAFFASGPAMTAVDLSTGTLRWHTLVVDPSDPAFSSVFVGAPAIANGRVVAAVSFAGGAGVISFDPANGTHTGTVGFHQIAGDVTADGALSANIGGAYGSGTPVLSWLNFQRTWFLSFGNGVVGGPITISGGRAFMAGGSVTGFDPATSCVPIPPPFPVGYCAPTWNATVAGALTVSNAGNGHIAATSSDGAIHVLDAATGAAAFTTTPVATILSPTAFASNNTIFAAGNDDVLRAYSANGCASGQCDPIWTASVGGAPTSGSIPPIAPTTFGGRVYVATRDGRLVAFSAAGCGAATCSPLAIGDEGHGDAATSKPIIRNGVALVSYGTTLVAFNLS